MCEECRTERCLGLLLIFLLRSWLLQHMPAIHTHAKMQWNIAALCTINAPILWLLGFAVMQSRDCCLSEMGIF